MASDCCLPTDSAVIHGQLLIGYLNHAKTYVTAVLEVVEFVLRRKVFSTRFVFRLYFILRHVFFSAV